MDLTFFVHFELDWEKGTRNTGAGKVLMSEFVGQSVSADNV
jgi:hypothetical protein